MILFLDLRNNAAIAGVIDAKRDRWVSVKGQRAGFLVFSRAKKLLGRKKPTCIVVAMGSGEKRDVSWSTIRAAVAMANAFAFAWNIPAVEMQVCGDESRTELATLVRSATKKAKKSHWVSASYNGEPNITKAKKIL